MSGNTDTIYTPAQVDYLEALWNWALLMRLRQIQRDPLLLSPGMRMREETEARRLHGRAMRQVAGWRRFLNEHFQAA